jgi:hypothetical protein
MTSHTHASLQPQEAFAELAAITLADHTVDSVMERVAALTKRTVPGADEVSVTLLERGRPRTVAFTGPLAMKLDERQYARGYGPCLDGIDGGEPVVIRACATSSGGGRGLRTPARTAVGAASASPCRCSGR